MRAEVFIDRDGAFYYRCPKCGMIFRKARDYSRHVTKSHPPKAFRAKKLKDKERSRETEK